MDRLEMDLDTTDGYDTSGQISTSSRYVRLDEDRHHAARQTLELGSIHAQEQKSTYQPPTPVDPLSLGQQQQQSAPPAEPVLVETVCDDDSESPNDDVEQAERSPATTTPRPVQWLLACMPRTQTRAIQCTMTALLVLLVTGLLLSLAVVQQYRLVLVAVWIVVLVLFAFFAWAVQETVNSSNQSRGKSILIFYPLLHAAAQWIQQEADDFRQDWQEQVLLITYEVPDSPTKELDNKNNNISPDDEGGQPQGKRGRKSSRFSRSSRAASQSRNDNGQQKPKSRIFRIFVKPFLPVLRKGKKKQNDELSHVTAEMNHGTIVTEVVTT